MESSSPRLECEIQSAVRIALGRDPSILLYRNAAGVSERQGRTQRFGLTLGAADLVGVLTINGVGISLWIEIKTARGRLSEHQERFRDLVTDRGAVYLVVRSAEEAVAGIAAARQRLNPRVTP